MRLNSYVKCSTYCASQKVRWMVIKVMYAKSFVCLKKVR